MSREASPVRGLLRTLRAGLAKPPGSDLAPLAPLVRQALAFVERGDPDDPDTAAEASALAFVLAALAEAGDEAFRLQVFGLFFRLGTQGELLAVAHLAKLPEDQALVLAANLALEEKLLFANAFLRRPRPDRPRTEAFALSAVAEAVEKSPDDLLILLDLLANRREYPALPLRNALVRGRLGVWLRHLLQLELSAEQVRYMARVAGRLRDPDLVGRLAPRLAGLDEESAEAVCRALAETPGLEAAVAAGPLETLLGQTREPSLLRAAVTALARCDETRAAAAVAGLLADKAWALPVVTPVLAGFSQAGFTACLRALPPERRGEALAAVQAVLAAALPGQLRQAARTVRPSPDCPADVARAFAADLAARTADTADTVVPKAGPATPGEPESPAGPAPDEPRLWNRVRGLLGGTAPAGEDAATASLRRALAKGDGMDGRQILWKPLDGARLTGNRLRRCGLKAVGLAESVWEDVVCTECALSDVDLEGARLHRVTFRRCRLTNCRFTRATLTAVRLEDCELRGCALGAITARDLAMTGVWARECDFFGAAIDGLVLTRSALRTVGLSRAVVTRLRLAGTRVSDCLLDAASLSGDAVAGLRTEGCSFVETRFAGPTDEPDLLGVMAKADRRALAAAPAGAPLPETLRRGAGLKLVAACVDAVLFARDIGQRRRAMLANNKRRLAWAARRFGPAKAPWLDLLPGLVQAGLRVEANGDVQPAPAARVAGAVPDLDTARGLAAFFRRSPAELAAAPEDALAVEAIYSIGSTGSVAQTGDSDMDIWVCLGPGQADRPEVPAFADKLEAIAGQAAREADLELHFFVMSVEDIRENRFGYSADEGYGSAQGRLLKEEFYRSALTLAGKAPGWWLTPPRADQAATSRAMARLARGVPETAAACLDFGPVETIAGDEFFGASLWMIVKSLSSPFKAVMKLGLLEKYAAEAGDPALLCESLKAHVFTDQGGLWRCDPYALLFCEVSRHYRRQGSAGTLELLRQAFLQKTGFDPSEEYRTRAGEALLDHFFPYAPAPGDAAFPPRDRKSRDGDGGFARVVALGSAITTYLLRAYGRLKDHAARLAGEGGLTERDETMLSRRIAASFGQQPGKILRLPFLRPGRELFASLEIAAKDGKQRLFCARGEPPAPARSARKKELVRRDASLVRLAAWLVANELYRPGQFLQAGPLPAPLALPDVTALLAAVHGTFPTQETFAPPLSQGLSPRCVTTALVVANLLSPREEKRLLELDVLYATNWGELCHARPEADLESLAMSPALFLADNLGLPLARGCRLLSHVPDRSQCQAVKGLAKAVG